VRAPAAVEVTIAAPSDSLLIRVSLSAEPWLEVRTGPGEVLDRIEFDEQILTVEPGSARSIGITLPARSRCSLNRSATSGLIAARSCLLRDQFLLERQIPAMPSVLR
jgi:hypothetical protein